MELKKGKICEESCHRCRVITSSIPQAPSVPIKMFLIQPNLLKGNFPNMTKVVT